MNAASSITPRTEVYRDQPTAAPVSTSVEIASAGAQLLTRQPAIEKYLAMQ